MRPGIAIDVTVIPMALLALIAAGCQSTPRAPVADTGTAIADDAGSFTDAGELTADAGELDTDGGAFDAGESDAFDAGESDAGRPPAVTFKERVDRWYEALGDPYTRCDAIKTDPSLVVGIYKDKARGNERPQPIFRSIALGEIDVDQAKLEACFDAFRNRPCSMALITSFNAFPECDGVFVPKRHLSETCHSMMSCELGSSCSPRCDGKCQPLTDNKCARNADCAEGLVCHRRANECVPPAPAGAEGQPCSPSGSCESGLYCHVDNFTTEVCKPLLVEGASCSDPLSCAEGLECGRYQCKPIAKVGDFCTDKQCSWAGSNLVCDLPISQCQPFPTSGPCLAGSACHPFLAWCDKTMTPPTCLPLKLPNAFCKSSSECAPTEAGNNVYCEADAIGEMRCLPAPPGDCD